IRRGEAANIGEDGGEIAAVHAEPGGDGREVLVDGRGRNPAASAGIVGSVDGERGKFPISLAAEDGAVAGGAGASENEMLAAPAVVAPLPVAWECAAEIAGGEGGHAILQPELLHGLLKSKERLAQFGEQIGVGADHHVAGGVRVVTGLAAVQIVAANLTEENLAFHAKTVGRTSRGPMAGFNQARDHF